MRSEGFSPGAILIKWDKIEKLYFNGEDFQYRVEYCEILTEPNSKSDNLCEISQCKMAIKELAFPENELEVKGQTPYTKYAYRVWAKNTKGIGPKPPCQVHFLKLIAKRLRKLHTFYKKHSRMVIVAKQIH